jgi:hypothetical protein
MKKRRWLFVVLIALSLIVASCGLAPPAIDVPSSGLRTSDGQLELSGTGLAGYEVQVVSDGQVLGATEVGADGTWSLNVTFVKPGEQGLTVRTLSRGYVVGESAPVPVSVSGVAETAQASTAPILEGSPPTLKLPAGGVLEAGTSVLTGTGEPGSDVQILIDGEVADVTEVDDDGAWSLDLSLLMPGDHELRVQALDASGEVIAETEPVEVSLTGEAEVAEAAAEDAPEAGEEEAAAPATDVTGPPEIVFPIDGADVIAGRLTLIGPGQPGAEVEILDGSAVLGTTQVRTDGEWRFTFEPQAGDYQLAVRAAGDTTTPGSSIAVRVAAGADVDCFSNPGIDRGEMFVVGTCDTLEDISKIVGVSLDDLEAANSQIADPNMVYPGDFVTIP